MPVNLNEGLDMVRAFDNAQLSLALSAILFAIGVAGPHRDFAGVPQQPADQARFAVVDGTARQHVHDAVEIAHGVRIDCGERRRPLVSRCWPRASC